MTEKNKVDWHARSKNLRCKIRNFINGEYRNSRGEKVIKKISPIDLRCLYEVRVGAEEDVEEAVVSSHAAFERGDWRKKPASERKSILLEFARLIENNSEELALLETLDVGKPISKALYGDVPSAAEEIRIAAESIDKFFATAHTDGPAPNLVYQNRKPLGVVAAIVGWNFPIVLACSKIGPALAMGNSLILKPSELTSLSAGRLAELAVEAGVPKGVFNVVTGVGNTVGKALAEHNEIALLSFTGSTATGKQLLKSSGNSNMKRLMLECGGKSPIVVFDDAPSDLDALAKLIVEFSFENQGQVCSAGTRLLVHETIKDQLLEKVVSEAKNIAPGDPLLESTLYGSMVSVEHTEKVVGYIDRARERGCRLLSGGTRVTVGDSNSYLMPTIVDEVDPASELARDEVFGPVLSVFTFENEGEAVKLANDTRYGLAAYLATQSLGRAIRMGNELEAGYIMILSDTNLTPGGSAPGVEPIKESGFGVEHGLSALASYSYASTVAAYG